MGTLGNDLAVLITEYDANLSHVESLLAGLSREQVNWRPPGGGWSIGESIAHLNLVNTQDAVTLREGIEHARERKWSGEGPFNYGFLSRKMIASMEPPVERRFRSPQKYVPPADADPREILEEYRRVTRALRELVQSAAGVDLRRAKTRLPALPKALQSWIRMPVGARLEMMAAHDRRHLWLAEAVRNHADFPA